MRGGARQILGDGQCLNIADAAAIEVAGRRVMNGVAAPPVIIRRERQNTDHAADPVVALSIREERAMPAIVLDHEQAHQKTGRR